MADKIFVNVKETVERVHVTVSSDQPDYGVRTSDLSEVAFSGDFNDLKNVPAGVAVPDQLSDLSEDATHRTVTDAEKATWSAKQAALGYTPVSQARTVAGKPLTSDVTLALSDLSQDATHRTVTDTEKAAWNAGGGGSGGAISFDAAEPTPADGISVLWVKPVGNSWGLYIVTGDGTFGPTSVAVAPATLGLSAGATGQLVATVSPTTAVDKTGVWSSSNPAIAAVSETGLVTGLAAGSVTISFTTTTGGKVGTSSIAVTVVAASGISIDQSSAAPTVGDSLVLTATVTPANASNHTVVWASSDTTVATIVSNTVGAVLTALKAGSTTITATDSAGHQATLVVTVQAATLTYTFEGDTVGAAPANVTANLGGGVKVASPTSTGGFTGITGKVIQSAAIANGGEVVATFDLWGTPSTADQVMTWRQWRNSHYSVTDQMIGIRLQTATKATYTDGSSAAQVRHQGYWFELYAQVARIIKTTTGDSTLIEVALDWSSPATTYFRAAALTEGAAVRLNFYTSPDNVAWTQIATYLDSTSPFLTSSAKPQFYDLSWDYGVTYLDSLMLTSAIPTNIPVTSIDIVQASNTGMFGTQELLTANILPTTATYKSITWSSSDASIAYVDTLGVLHRVSPGIAIITATSSNSLTDTLTANVTDATGVIPKMKIGVNFWTKEWAPDADMWLTGITPAQWASAAYNAGTRLMSLNPWATQTLTDLGKMTGPIRFMDLDSANSNCIVNWSDRIQPNVSQYNADSGLSGALSTTVPAGYPMASSASLIAYEGGTSTWGASPLAYEWMIDLCNRTGRDMWLNVPAFASTDYMTQLATLVNTRLRSDLTCYVEYCNENWNYISVAYQWSLDAGPALSYPGEGGALTNMYYQGMGAVMHRAIQMWKVFYDVFGSANVGYGKRLVRVLAGSGNSDITLQAIKNVIYAGSLAAGFNTTYNPNGMTFDTIACAPYIGPEDSVNGGNLDGADASIATKYRAQVDYMMAQYVPAWKSMSTTYGAPLIFYEGGQQLGTNANTWSLNPLMYAETQYYLNQLAAKGGKLFAYYTLYGGFSATQAWGLKQYNTSDEATSYKWKAVVDWINS